MTTPLPYAERLLRKKQLAKEKREKAAISAIEAPAAPPGFFQK